ncbi:MAG: SIR2 family protein, partial [Anaerolineaceae bacterium]|nr:SIR2 family protein [Anaerolineaceae bacterium]
IGQKELLFSNPQQIGEIYKIHGCSSVPSSLVLTSDDYREFNERNAYLAAKLITLFVEHPIVFIGYRIADPNVSRLLCAVASCIGSENVEQLRKNLIFVQRLETNEKEAISDTYLTIDGAQIPLVLVKTNNFVPIYEAIDSTKRKIPARVLRYCKEQLYELVKSSEPEKKICVVDIDEIDKKEDVEFLVGVGMASGMREHVAEVGYATIESHDLLADLLHEDRNYDAQQIVENVVRSAGRNTKNIPVFKYLHAIGIDSEEKYQASGYQLDKWVKRDLKDFRVKTYAGPFFRNYRRQTMKDIIDGCTPENAAAYIPYLAKEKIDVVLLRDFLIENQNKMNYAVSGYASSYRKLAVLYDKIKWGW